MLMTTAACSGKGTPGDTRTAAKGGSRTASSGVSFRTPPRVVGSWCGGTDAAAHWTYVFADDGRYTRSDGKGQGDSGIARFDSAQLTLLVGGRPLISYPWSLKSDPTLGDLLYIDGFSYVRGKCS
ncbi:hypothetical protein [Streptomyces coffeae]|uniref:Uncharacterized protein n=1 Tax=Streptomyces coffeae TaxID=621382 RepID=A0ABS1NND9_9ACTN|nr:hypothetical protein [Streptomyces coffeae]MBL1101603.1 hypothetical protein [Streptomyces coffeae]